MDKRGPIVRDAKWLEHLRTEPCVISGLHASDSELVVAAHTGTAGRGIKSSDDEALPILNRYHQMQPEVGEITMWRRHAPDWLLRAALRAYARTLYTEWKDGQK